MTRVLPVELAYNPRTLWFDPRDLEPVKGDAVIVQTARGLEFGRAVDPVFEATEEQIAALRSPLMPVERIATADDVARAEELQQKSLEALEVFREFALEANEEMHPVSVEYLFDGDKAVFYFESDKRIDFRDLVRKLAAEFHVRIDMRQIGVRDEARIIGGLGHCGQELCCKRLGGEFCPVSIRMAKEQDLSLNPQKVSGLCGRLMCCLRYEYDAYKDFKSRAPKQNATIQTPAGPAKVVDLDVPREIVTLRVEGEKPVRIPLAEFDPNPEGGRPNTVSSEAWEAYQDPMVMAGNSVASAFGAERITGSDKLAEAGKVRRTGGRAQTSNEGEESSSRKRRKRSDRSERSGSTQEKKTEQPRRARRSVKLGASSEEGSASRNSREAQSTPSHRQERQRRSRNGKPTEGAPREGRPGTAKDPRKKSTTTKVRPGQKSSGLREHRQGDNGQNATAGKAGAPNRSDAGHRKPRRRKGSSGSSAKGSEN